MIPVDVEAAQVEPLHHGVIELPTLPAKGGERIQFPDVTAAHASMTSFFKIPMNGRLR